jgi:DNA-binding NarL/FixJ family response regulator
MKTTVFIVDDHQIVREGFSMILDNEPDIVVLGTADSSASALEQIPALRPDVVLMDIELPDQDGTATTRLLRRQCPGIKVIIVSSFSKQSIVEQALQAGALGYVLKTNPPEELFQAIRSAATGRLFLSQEVSAGIIEACFQQPTRPPPPKAPLLSMRERQVLDLMVTGLKTKDIALKLGISPRTVETYRSRLRSKFACKSNVELVRRAIQEGLLAV